MKPRLNKLVSYGIPAIQQYCRDLTQYQPPPRPYQIWMCPACEHIHPHYPVTDEYKCDECGWTGDRHRLLRGEAECLTTT